MMFLNLETHSFIDRDPKHFAFLLNLIRNDEERPILLSEHNLSSRSNEDLHELIVEAKFYQM